jgi:16S rRNA (adenine1518-N6/adenine1519-N6)-dimethyltransferase
VLEIGPGPGVLTKYFIKEPAIEFHAVEVDARMVELLTDQYPSLKGKIIQEDFLDFDIDAITKDTLSIVGNFPYNISSQILFKVLAQKDRIHI